MKLKRHIACWIIGIIMICSVDFPADAARIQGQGNTAYREEKGQHITSVEEETEIEFTQKEIEFTQNLYAQSATLMDAESGRILFAKNGEEKKSNASTTKILTCILVLELEPDLEQVVEVSSYAAGQPRVHLGMGAGEHYKVKDLLYSMMLESHNDAAVALAEYVGRKEWNRERAGEHTARTGGQTVESDGQNMESGLTSEQAVLFFADKMNEKAKEIGCRNTCFVTPNGLDATRIRRGEIQKESNTEGDYGSVNQEKHGTTSNDLALLMAYCVTKSPCREQFLEITKTPSYTFGEQGQKRQFSLRNHNALLEQRQDALSGKTGFTSQAGYCYVGTIDSEGRIFCVALLGAGWPNHKSYKWEDCRKLFGYGTEYYHKISLEQYRKEICEQEKMPVEQGAGKTLFDPAFSTASVDPVTFENCKKELLVNDGENLRIEKTFFLETGNKPLELSENSGEKPILCAPVEAGEKVGEVRVYVEDYLWQSFPVYTRERVEEATMGWYVYQIWMRFSL